MATLLKKILQDSIARIFAIVFFGLLLFALFFVVFGYQYSNNLRQEGELEKLRAIANTTSVNIKGSDIEYLLNKYSGEDAIARNSTDSTYAKISNYLKKVQKSNSIESDIYILTKDQDNLYFMVTSGSTPYYFHKYNQAPAEIIRNWALGGDCPKYEDENGTWLSSFAPIRNEFGLVNSIVMVDLNFEKFILKSKMRLYVFLGVTLGILFVIGIVLLTQIRRILSRENLLKEELINNKNLLEVINKETESSIYYAKQIQNSVLPKPRNLKQCFTQSFVINQPLNIVGGDFWFHARVKNKTVLILADCTGHGVPGAFMSLIGFNIIYNIVKIKEIIDPAKILQELNKGIIQVLSEEGEATRLMDGMDVSVAVIDQDKKIIEYSGAYRPLLFIDKKTKKIKEYKGQRFSLGQSYDDNVPKNFVKEMIPYFTGDQFYMFSDGVTDQFGGPKNKKISMKRLKNTILSNAETPMKEQQTLLQEYIRDWKGEEAQIDDILLLGFKL